jgi:hypothetical protein
MCCTVRDCSGGGRGPEVGVGDVAGNIQLVPRSKHSVVQLCHLMLYREIIVVCSQIHTQQINTLCGQNVELLNVKHGGI